MERNIPHIRDIFSSSRKKSNGDIQDLCPYEKSPRSRRKNKNYEPSPDYEQEKNSSKKKNDKSSTGKENQKNKITDESRLLSETPSKQNWSAGGYSSKTLTERDIRHLERHLSMKKTIRKQISRNLAQALIDNPNIFEPESKPEKKLSKTEIAEQKVLDMLAFSIDDRDSGHSSPINDGFDDDYEEEEDSNLKGWNAKQHRNSETKLLGEEKNKSQRRDFNNSNDKKSSIWKMFSPRNKGKR